MTSSPRGSRDEIVAQLCGYLGSITATEISPDDDYFALGLVNSLRALEIVAYVEQTFRVTVEVDDLDLNNFRTATRIAEFVRGKHSTATVPAE